MFNVYDRYIMRQLLVSTLVVATCLSMIVLLTQSLRLIELVLEANASSGAFFTMLALSLPRFFETVFPASVLIATLFVMNRLSMDSESIVMRASGASPWRMAKPVLKLGLYMTLVLLVLSLWISPVSISGMHALRQEIRTQYSHLLFKDGVFNTVGRNLTAYVQARAPDGRLLGLMLHDTRGPNPVTVIARSGQMIDDDESRKILVFDGSRQEFNPVTGKFSRLDFRQYTLEMPAGSTDTSERWREPDERTIGELTNPQVLAGEDPKNLNEFRAEAHRRFTTPILMLAFGLLAAAFMLLGGYSRKGQMPMIIAASLSAIAIQGTYILAYNLAKETALGCALLYAIAALPLLLALWLLHPHGETLLEKLKHNWTRRTGKSA